MNRHLRITLAVALAALWFSSILLPTVAPAQEQDAAATEKEQFIRQELEYVRQLQQILRMPDFADKVIQELKRKYPDAGAKLKVLEIQGLLYQGSFDKVKEVIAALPDKNGAEAWAMKLAMADSYFAFSHHAEAFALYDAFFKQFSKPPPELESFYLEAAYKYPQMLLLARQDMKALEAYFNLHKLKLPKHMERQIKAETAELVIRLAESDEHKAAATKYLADAEKLVDNLLWDPTDIWFGRAIVMKAHIKLIQGKLSEAQQMVEFYLPQLLAIHNALIEQDKEEGTNHVRLSPMPACRYLLAVMLNDEALKISRDAGFDEEKVKTLLFGERQKDGSRKGNGAYNHFINVFIRYPESQWAAEAGERAEQIRAFVKEKFNADIKQEVTEEQLARVRQMQFADARTAFNENRFADAINLYLGALNSFGEAPEAVPALGELAKSYLEAGLDDPMNTLMFETVMAHLGECFANHPALSNMAGDELRRLADYCGSQGMEDYRRRGYDLFFRNYPNNPNAALLVMNFGGNAYKAQDYSTALEYYKRVVDVYPNSPWVGDALSRVATIYSETQQYTNELNTLSTYVAYLEKNKKPGISLMSARFRYAQGNRNYGAAMLRDATNETEQVIAVKTLLSSVAAFDKTANELTSAQVLGAAEKEQAQQMLEQSVFQKALALSQITYPQDKLDLLRQKAIDAYDDFIKRFSNSKLAPRAMLQIGTMQTVLKQTEKAQETLAKLRKDYPDSDEARSSVPMLAASLMELNLRAEGVAMYKQMFADTATKYTDAQMLAAGKALVEAIPPESELALQAFERVIAASQEQILLAHARLGKAQALVQLKKFEEANQMLTAFIKDFGNLQLVVDANYLLSETASRQGETERDDAKRKKLFNTAVDALRMVKRYRTKPTELLDLDIAAGRVLLRKYNAEKLLGLTDQATKTRGEAIVAFKLIIMQVNPGNADLAAQLQVAYHLAIPLMLEHGAAQAAVEDSEAYLRSFPNGKFVTDVRIWLNQAQIELSTRPGAAKAATPDTGKEEN